MSIRFQNNRAYFYFRYRFNNKYIINELLYSINANCSEDAQKINNHGKNNPNWKGGIKICSGYVEVYSPTHPYRAANNRVRRSRLVMEKLIGRYLLKNEIVHHIDRNTLNDKINNLQLVTISEHMKIHNTGCNNPHWKVPIVITCAQCGIKFVHKNRKRKFCSMDCGHKNQHKYPILNKKCKFCKKKLILQEGERPSHLYYRNFCNRLCVDDWQRLNARRR